MTLLRGAWEEKVREMIHDGRKVKIRAGFFLESSFFIYIYIYVYFDREQGPLTASRSLHICIWLYDKMFLFIWVVVKKKKVCTSSLTVHDPFYPWSGITMLVPPVFDIKRWNSNSNSSFQIVSFFELFCHMVAVNDVCQTARHVHEKGGILAGNTVPKSADGGSGKTWI